MSKKEPTRIIIAGGRDESINHERLVWLNDIMETFDPDKKGSVEIVSGAARGIDTFAIAYARACGLIAEVFPANWDTHGKAAGPIRNRQMAEYADVCILFPGGRGTANMKSEATKAGLTIHEWTS